MSKNLATTTIVSHPGPPTSATSVTVATGTGSRLFTGMAVIHPADAVPTAANAEVVSITDVTGDVVTIVRTQESSTARAIVTGDILTQGITAAMWDTLVSSNAGKAAASHVHSAADVTSGALPLARGGTGGTDAATARTSLGLGTAATMSPATIAADVALTGTYGPGGSAGNAPLASPAFTGSPTAPTPAPGDNDTTIATTAFAMPRPSGTPTVGQVPVVTTANPLALGWGAGNDGSRRNSMPGQVVSTNCYGMGHDVATPGAGTARIPHIIAWDASDLRLLYTNTHRSGATEIAGPDTLTVRASIEISSTIFRVTFNGQTTATIDPGGWILSDPLPANVAKGSVVWSRTYSSGISIFCTQPNYSTSTGGGFVATTDLTAPGSGAVPASVNFIYGPVAVIAIPRTFSAIGLAGIGDSISAGQQDSGSGLPASLQAYGWVARITQGQIGLLTLATPGDTASNWATASPGYRRRLLSAVSVATEAYGINDASAGRTLAQIQADRIGIWRECRYRGVACFAATITPRTTSTDSWATTGNQTPFAGDAVRVSLNQWLRAGAPVNASTFAAVTIGTAGALLAPVYDAAGTQVSSGTGGHPAFGIIDPAAGVESAVDSGLWKVGHTGDGLHPNGTGHIAMAATVPISALLTAVA